MSYDVKRDSLISDIGQKCPRAIELLTDYGLSCATCFLNQFDNIEAGATLHGMTKEEIDRMIGEINEVLKEEEL